MENDDRVELVKACREIKALIEDCVSAGDLRNVVTRIRPFLQQASMSARGMGYSNGPVELICVERRDGDQLVESVVNLGCPGTFVSWNGPVVILQYGYEPLDAHPNLGSAFENAGVFYDGPIVPTPIHEGRIFFDPETGEGHDAEGWRSVAVTVSQWARQVEQLKETPKGDQTTEKLVTINEVAKMVHRSQTTVRGWSQQWPEPKFRGGGRAASVWELSKIRDIVSKQSGQPIP